MVLELKDSTWDKEVKESEVPVIVDFWATWCGPCKMMAPVFDEISKDYDSKLKFTKLSTEDFPDLAGQNMISGIPCLVIYNKGEEVDRIVGFNPKPALKEKIDAILKKI
jgi:thioredoxin 1